MTPSLDAIQEEAAAWFARRRDGVHAPGEEAAFEAWRGRSDAHARIYAETERAWKQWKQLQNSTRMREMAAAAMAATAHRQRQTKSKRRWPLLAAAACLVAVAVFGTMQWLPLMKHTQPVVYSTSLGERQTEKLPDGTRIVLNTQTTLQVRYNHQEREVTLQHGEAMFEVAHNAQHPFKVIVGGGSVTDLGTKFQVRHDDGMTAVTLLHGKVRVTAHGKSRPLSPGEQARYSANSAGINVRRVDTAVVTSWMRGRLDFRGLPLAQAVAEANRYSAVKLRLGDPKLASLPVSGSFRAGDNAAIAAALCAVFPVRVGRRNAHEIVLMPR